MNLSLKSGLLGHFWTRKLSEKILFAYRKETRRRMGYVRTYITEITKPHCTRDLQLEIFSSQREKAMTSDLFKWYRECVCVHMNIILSIFFFLDKLSLLLYGVTLDKYREYFVALGGDSCSSSREPGSDSYIQLAVLINMPLDKQTFQKIRYYLPQIQEIFQGSEGNWAVFSSNTLFSENLHYYFCQHTTFQRHLIYLNSLMAASNNLYLLL
jgi:hypothetical protein